MIPYDLPPYFMLSWMFLYGAVIGSFLTVCVHRLPMYQGLRAGLFSLVKSASHCDHCHQKLLARDNIPILGWVLLGGRCRFCKTGIPVKYPLIELANGLLFVFLYAMEVPLNHWNPLADSCLSTSLSTSTFDNVWGLSPLAMVNGRCFYHLALFEMLLVAALIAWDTRTIPRSVTVPALLVGVLSATAVGSFWIVPLSVHTPDVSHGMAHSQWHFVSIWMTAHPHLHGLAVSLAGLLAGGALMWTVRGLTSYFLEKEVFGESEVLLMAAIGSFIGWQPVVVVCWLATSLIVISTYLSSWGIIRREVPVALLFSLATGCIILAWRWTWSIVEWNFSTIPVLLLTTAILLKIMSTAVSRHTSRHGNFSTSGTSSPVVTLPALRLYSGDEIAS